MMKKLAWWASSLFGIGALALIMQFGVIHYEWTWPFGSDSKTLTQADRPPYVMSNADPAFGPECGEDRINVGGGGYSINTDLEYHTKNSVAIVEGTARVSGPAQFGNLAYSPDMDEFERIDAASGINTPFTIEVSNTIKGPEEAEWTVFEAGGLVGCVSYRQNADEARLFDGANGLFFISTEPREFQAPWVFMTIATDGPDWFGFTEHNLGTVDQAIEFVSSH
ncbi:MAG: hypothetical protein WD208_08525 [Dehalococcoidia bacterium]